jgi:hypothetical protein
MSPTIVIPTKHLGHTYLLDEGGNSILRVRVGDEETLKKILASDLSWTLAESVCDTHILFNLTTFEYIVLYPSRKVQEHLSVKDLITIARIFSSFTGLRYYLKTE